MNKYLVYSKPKFIGLIALKAVYAAAFVGFALILQWLVNVMTKDGVTATEFITGVGITMAYVVVFTAILLIKDKLSTLYICSAVKKLRDDMTKRLLFERYEDFVKNDTAKYLSHLTNDVTVVTNSYFKSVMTMPEEIFTFIFAVGAAFSINYIVALTMLGLTLLIFIVPIVFNKPLNNANVKVSDAVKNYTAALKETFLGMDVVKNFGSEERMAREIGAINETLKKKNSRLDTLNLFAGDVGIFIVVLLQLGSIAIAGFMYLEEVVMLGAVIAVVQLSSNMYSPLMQTAGKAALISGVKELNKVLMSIAGEPDSATGRLERFTDGIRVENLSFGYGDSGEAVLDGVTAAFEKGKKYLLIGKSGSGKSTLLKLVNKTYNDYGGKITIDEADYRGIAEKELNKHISAAQQKSYLFDLSVRENIDFNGTGDETLLNRAIDTAELKSFVESERGGLDAVINEEVNQISGGEKQRIGLARAIYKNADILLLDEVTSSLDNETAHKVEENILNLEGKTVLNVSHKLHADLIAKYDAVCVMENGKIAAFGAPESIAASGILEQFIAE